jgi:hypothetical protein
VTPESTPSATDADQRLLIPAYFYPFGTLWQEMADELAARGIKAAIVANPANGPGPEADWMYGDAIAYCRSKGHTVLGYVDTSHRLRKLSAVRADVDEFFRLYPAIEGIFLDQVSNEPQRKVKRYYRDLYRYIKDAWPGSLVVANAGVPALTRWPVRGGGIADVLCVFEGAATDYLEWSPPRWVRSKDASTFAHLVYATEDADMTTAVAKASHDKHADWLFVTRGAVPNPWGLPPEPAMYDHPGLERGAVSAP